MLKEKTRRRIEEHLKKRDPKRMRKAAEDMDRIAKELEREGNPTGWSSTKELRKHRYGKC